MVEQTCLLADFYGVFDAVLLGDDPTWYGEDGKSAVLAAVALEILDGLDPTCVSTWGERQQLIMTNVFFAGKLPGWLGFDHGPIELEGSRATVVQGGVLTAHGRLTTFAPSWRMITDLGSRDVRTALPGGPSGNRFSRHYVSDVKRWVTGEYKVLRLEA
jgi:penicillin amidase